MTQMEQAFHDGHAEIRERMADAARQSGRRPEEITLLAVTKYVDEERMRLAQAAGLMAFGENYPQQILAKAPAFPQISWHLIGHLQTNKVKYMVGLVSLLQSLDSERLADALERQCVKADTTQEVLLQVNIGREAQKSGVLPEGAEALLAHTVAQCPHLRVRGLMTIPPAGEDPEATRAYFAATRQLFDRLAHADSRAPLDTLSMGMSADYEAAILEGATMVRIGTLLFGRRPPKA